MPHRTLQFCPTCMATQHAAAHEKCRTCATELLRLVDDNGALSQAFLSARGTCCDTGCRNCPYPGSSNSKQLKHCEKCGTAFGCHSVGCWCESVELSAATLKWLSRTYDDCLCPACLAELAAT
jgi:ribosomal protein L40E